ncbi:MAG TPA: Spy/CpxP family protein refolding chaperone [Azonexus sp.]|nr:Spy/CpxP family protein refolding chaperone [Azonexus sp.]
MTNISSSSIRRYLAVAALALAIPLTVVANSAGPREAGGGGHCSGMDGRGPMGKRGGEMGPHYLRGLNLTEAQRDKVFEVMHAQAPLMREKAKAHQAAEAELRKLAAGPDFSEAKARGLADNLGKSVGEMALARAKSDRQIFDILTPEQRQQLAEMKPGGDGKRSPNDAARGMSGNGRNSPPAH